MDKKAFIDKHFPPDVVKRLVKVGFFKQKKPTHDEIEARVCQWFRIDSIFEYEDIGKGMACHLSLVKPRKKPQS